MLWLVLARVALPRPVADDGIQHLNDPAPTPRAFVFDRSARGDGTLRCPKCGRSPDGKSNCCSEGGTWQGQCTLTLADGGQHTWSDGYDACDDSIALHVKPGTNQAAANCADWCSHWTVLAPECAGCQQGTNIAAASVLAFASSAAAFSAPTMTFSLGKKKAAAPPKPTGASPSADAWANAGPSQALPWATAPATLDGSMLGDVGFDPLGFSTVPVGPWFTGLEGRNGQIGNLAWYREAELIHGRIAQVAVLGFLGPGLFGTLPGNEWTGVDAYSNLNPLDAFSQVPGLAILQIFLFMTYLEIRRINIIKEEGENYTPGDLRIGQGEGRWNPFGLEYSEEAYEEKQLQELKHCRLAMIGVFGLWAQAQASGVGVTEQIGAALVAPDYYAKAGYFLPEGI